MDSLSLETADDQHYTIRISAADAMEYEYGEESVQTKAIAALNQQDEQSRPPDAAMFLLKLLELDHGNSRYLDENVIRDMAAEDDIVITDLALPKYQ